MRLIKTPEQRQAAEDLFRVQWATKIAREALVDIPKSVIEGVSLEGIARCMRGRKHNQLAFSFHEDGVATYHTNEVFLEDRSHRFTFPEDPEADITYHRESYNIDCQAIGSRALNLAGAEALAEVPNAITELEFVSRTMHLAHTMEWPLEEGRRSYRTC